jgi:hypothetical protein
MTRTPATGLSNSSLSGGVSRAEWARITTISQNRHNALTFLARLTQSYRSTR